MFLLLVRVYLKLECDVKGRFVCVIVDTGKHAAMATRGFRFPTITTYGATYEHDASSAQSPQETATGNIQFYALQAGSVANRHYTGNLGDSWVLPSMESSRKHLSLH